MTPKSGAKVEAIDKQIADLMAKRASAAVDDLLPLREQYAALVDQITKQVQPYGLTASQFLGMSFDAVRRHIESGGQAVAPPPRPRVPAKYRHPTKKDLTWTGRGNKPLWVVDYLEDGGDLDSLLIDKTKKKERPKVAIPAKYRNPANPQETWTGRGAKPVWVRDYLATGKLLESILITGEAEKRGEGSETLVQIPRSRGARAAKRKQGGRRAKKR